MSFELDQLNAVTLDWYKSRVTDVFFRENIMLYLLMGSGKMELNMVTGKDLVDGGLKIREFLEYGRSNVSTYGNTSTIETSKVDIHNAARFGWSGYVGSNAIDLDEQTQNNGKAAMVDLSYSKLKNIDKSIRDYMGEGIYLGRAATANGYGFSGLPDLFNTTTSTAYGSITQDDMPEWKANVDSDVEAISYVVLQKLFRLATIGTSSGSNPNQIVTTQVLLDAYKASLQVQQRFIGSDIKLVQAGFKNVLHDGVPMVYDVKQADGVIDCLNTNFLKIKTHVDFNFTKPKWIADEKTEPDMFVANTRWRGALVCSNRKAHARGASKTAA